MPLKITKPKGRNYWYIVGSVAGVRIRESAQTSSKAVAESLRVKRESELEQCRIYGPQSVATFARAVNLYLDRGGEDRFLTPLIDKFGPVRLADLSQGDIDAAAREIYPGAKISTLNRQAYTPFIAVMNEGAINRLCPYQKWRRPKGHNERTKYRWLWPNEFEALYEEIHAPLRPIIVYMVGSGPRWSETRPLDWRSVSLQTGESWAWKTKNRQSRKLILPARTIAEMANIKGRTGLCFGKRKNIRTAFSNAVKRSGIDYCTPHDLRHTFATWFYSDTLDRERLKAVGGWKSDEVDRYVHLAPRNLGPELRKYGWDFRTGTNQDSSVPELRQL